MSGCGRFYDVSEDLRCCILDSVTIRRRVRVQGLHHRFHEFGKVGMDDKRFLLDMSKRLENLIGR